MRLRDFKERILRATAGADDGEVHLQLNAFLTGLARFDDRDVEEVIKMFALLRASESAEASVLRDLRATFNSDVEFREVIQAMKFNKAIGREALNRIYCALFDKTRPLASKATRDKLIQDIADLRLERVRSKRAAEYFAGKAAE